MVGNQTNPDPNAEQPAGGQDYAKWAAGLGAMGLAALYGLGPRGQKLVQAAHRYFPEWAEQLHNLPAPAFLAAPASRLSTRGDAEIMFGHQQTPGMLNLLRSAGAPLGEPWQAGAQGASKPLPAGLIRIEPGMYNALTGGRDMPKGVSILGHELSHMQGGLESLSETAPYLASNPSDRALRTMATQANDRLSPDVEANMDTLMEGLANKKWGPDLTKMYAAYREDEPGIPGVSPMEALSEVLTEIMARNRTMQALPGTDPAELVTPFRAGKQFLRRNPNEFQQTLGALALRRLKLPPTSESL